MTPFLVHSIPWVALSFSLSSLPQFAGFSSESLCERILDSSCSLLITTGDYFSHPFSKTPHTQSLGLQSASWYLGLLGIKGRGSLPFVSWFHLSLPSVSSNQLEEPETRGLPRRTVDIVLTRDKGLGVWCLPKAWNVCCSPKMPSTGGKSL